MILARLFLCLFFSGLDSVTTKQCIALLKQLAKEGRTIICTIHQPSATLLNMIDHIYVVADGSCVYTGSTQNLVPYLSSVGLHCPKHYNPADFCKLCFCLMSSQSVFLFFFCFDRLYAIDLYRKKWQYTSGSLLIREQSLHFRSQF